jgi:hypothetical protein
MTSSIESFLTDLYALDPSLREHEEQLIPLIRGLLENDPSLPPDPGFVMTLRTRLKERGAQLSAQEPSSLSPFSLMHKLFYTLGGALAVAIVLPAVYLTTMHHNPPAGPTGAPLFGFKVEDGGKNEFGPLKDVAMENSQAQNPRPQSGGGGAGNPAVLGTREAISADYGVGTDMKMIAPWNPVHYNYIFDGELPELAAQVAVYKREEKKMSVPFSQIASSFNLGNINVNSFNGATIETINFAQNVPYGYNVSVNMRDGSVGINAQWEQWPMSKCQNEACYAAQRVKLSDVPSDETAIGIAKAFLDAHGIDMSAYGEPEVDSTWKRDYERATDKSNAYVPDTVRVVFPLMIDGKPTYDQSGMKSGISVGVHSKEKKVFDVWGIMDRTYRKSDYAGVTDAAKIKQALSKIDNFPIPVDPMPMPLTTEGGAASSVPAPKEVSLSLGTPTLSLATFYRYENGMGEELLVPSLIFPVQTPKDADFYYRSNIVIPLAQEMFDQQGQMYIMEGAVR